MFVVEILVGADARVIPLAGVFGWRLLNIALWLLTMAFADPSMAAAESRRCANHRGCYGAFGQ
jgi:hypothetical protein